MFILFTTNMARHSMSIISLKVTLNHNKPTTNMETSIIILQILRSWVAVLNLCPFLFNSLYEIRGLASFINDSFKLLNDWYVIELPTLYSRGLIKQYEVPLNDFEIFVLAKAFSDFVPCGSIVFHKYINLILLFWNKINLV